jgi:hypothetical protein
VLLVVFVLGVDREPSPRTEQRKVFIDGRAVVEQHVVVGAETESVVRAG